ncbi:hypothetical protein EJB05_09395, partial [Eragrostis curvula]
MLQPIMDNGSIHKVSDTSSATVDSKESNAASSLPLVNTMASSSTLSPWVLRSYLWCSGRLVCEKEISP